MWKASFNKKWRTHAAFWKKAMDLLRELPGYEKIEQKYNRNYNPRAELN